MHVVCRIVLVQVSHSTFWVPLPPPPFFPSISICHSKVECETWTSTILQYSIRVLQNICNVVERSLHRTLCTTGLPCKERSTLNAFCSCCKDSSKPSNWVTTKNKYFADISFKNRVSNDSHPLKILNFPGSRLIHEIIIVRKLSTIQ